ncbi:hypothetical protein HKK55_19570 [Pseudomonas sp. ADAK18]|nr:hypothetical protein HKK55_19570 [Pseudomonas sp. ADAK18]
MPLNLAEPLIQPGKEVPALNMIDKLAEELLISLLLARGQGRIGLQFARQVAHEFKGRVVLLDGALGVVGYVGDQFRHAGNLIQVGRNEQDARQ